MFRVRCGEVDLERRVVRRGESRVDLTPYEVATLRYLHTRAGRVVTREELLREIRATARRRGLRGGPRRHPAAPDQDRARPVRAGPPEDRRRRRLGPRSAGERRSDRARVAAGEPRRRWPRSRW